jgi:hypothetical protein
MFSVRGPCREDTREYRNGNSLTRVEAGLNTYTVTQQVVGGDEKGSLKSERVIYDHESQGTRIRERLRWRGQQHIQKTDPSSRRGGRPTKQDCNCQGIINMWS